MIKVIFRKDKKTKEVIGFIPQSEVRWGNIMGYAHEGEHFEADLLYYMHNTEKASEEEYQSLFKEMQSRYSNLLELRQKLYHKDLNWKN